MTRREHVEQLAAEMNATISYDRERYRMAVYLPDRILHLAPWDEDVPETELYWVALHELGHLAEANGADSVLLFPWEQADDEARAWVWALDHSLFPVDQAAQSSIAWGIADRIAPYGWEPSAALQRIYETLGPEPDWYMNVVTPDHYRKLEGWAKPAWAELTAHYGDVKTASAESAALPAG